MYIGTGILKICKNSEKKMFEHFNILRCQRSTQNTIKMLKILYLFCKSVNGQIVLQNDQKGLLRVFKGKNRVYVHWHRNTESLREC